MRSAEEGPGQKAWHVLEEHSHHPAVPCKGRPRGQGSDCLVLTLIPTSPLLPASAILRPTWDRKAVLQSPPPRCGWPPGHVGGQWRWVWNGKGQINACMTGEDVTSSLLGSGVENFAKVLEPLILPLVSISVPMAPYHHQHSGW